MYFDRNISENKFGKKNEGSYLSCVTNGEFYFITMHNRTSQRIQCFCLLFPGPVFPLFHDITKNLIFQRVQCMFSLSKNSVYWDNKQQSQAQSDQCKIPSDGVPIGRWRCNWQFFRTPWLNKSDSQPPEGDYMKFVLICLNK